MYLPFGFFGKGLKERPQTTQRRHNPEKTLIAPLQLLGSIWSSETSRVEFKFEFVIEVTVVFDNSPSSTLVLDENWIRRNEAMGAKTKVPAPDPAIQKNKKINQRILTKTFFLIITKNSQV